VEFTYNNTPSSTTRTSLFFANKGYHPRVQFQVQKEPSQGMADSFVSDLKKIHDKLKQTIWTAQHCYQTTTDRKCSPDPKIQVGDQVFILAKFVRTTQPSKKLAERYLGPFKVLGKPGTHSYLVKLPNHLRTIHPVFHVSQLEPAHSS